MMPLHYMRFFILPQVEYCKRLEESKREIEREREREGERHGSMCMPTTIKSALRHSSPSMAMASQHKPPLGIEPRTFSLQD